MPRKLPPGPALHQHRPGAGLNLFGPEEAPTLKRPAIPEEGPTHKLPVVASAAPGESICPLCQGGGELHTTPYAKSTCPTCAGHGTVPRDVFDRFLAEHPHSLAARQLAKQSTK